MFLTQYLIMKSAIETSNRLAVKILTNTLLNGNENPN